MRALFDYCVLSGAFILAGLFVMAWAGFVGMALYTVLTVVLERPWVFFLLVAWLIGFAIFSAGA